ncbi:MAG: hypothetical protein GEU81_13545 [Nitriliruptorales bacterium]|nr:hypothetical protein [Nitriliruptorales bacterium]
MRDVQALVDAADSAELLIAVDRLAAARDWEGLRDLAHRCREAVEFGRQLWPVAMHIDYRLAWEAPADYAAGVLRPGAGRFALGPLTEVAASNHEWAALAPHLGDAASTSAVAQERVLRGEDLRAHARQIDRGETDALPLRLMDWEPVYALPRYRDRSAAFPQPDVALRTLPPPGPLPDGGAVDDDEAVRALRDTVETWVSQSAGSVAAVAVEGDAAVAVGALAQAHGGQAALLGIQPAEALALLQWAGASGGAYGRRPGGARGRFMAWWAAIALAGLSWPPDPDDLGQALAELRWYRWAPGAAEKGWILRLAIEDPIDGLAWAVDATDHREEEPGHVDEPAELHQ